MELHPGGGTILLIEIAFYILLLVLCGLLSAAGKAIPMVNRNDIRKLAEDGDGQAVTLVHLFDRTYRLLASVQAVTTFSGLMAGGVLAYTAVHRFSRCFVTWGLGGFWAKGVALVVLMILASCAFLVLARVFPQQIAIQNTEQVALSLAGYARFFIGFCRPFVAISNGLTNALLTMTRQERGIAEEGFSEENVMSMLEQGQESGEIKEEGKKMIHSIFAFDDKLAHEVMTPRTEVFAIDVHAPVSEYLNELMEMRYSRIPVYEDDIDNIIGILNIKDYMRKAREYGFEHVYLDRILRKPFFVPDSKNIDSLFVELQQQRQHIAVLIDEYGGFTGIVTMEDIIEEVMGDIDDEYDEEEPQIIQVNEDTFLVEGSMDLDDINEQTGADLASENSETVGGLLLDLMGEVPDHEEHYHLQIRYDHYLFTIESVRDHRLERIRMQILPALREENEEKEQEQKE